VIVPQETDGSVTHRFEWSSKDRMETFHLFWTQQSTHNFELCSRLCDSAMRRTGANQPEDAVRMTKLLALGRPCRQKDHQRLTSPIIISTRQLVLRVQLGSTHLQSSRSSWRLAKLCLGRKRGGTMCPCGSPRPHQVDWFSKNKGPKGLLCQRKVHTKSRILDQTMQRQNG